VDVGEIKDRTVLQITLGKAIFPPGRCALGVELICLFSIYARFFGPSLIA
jgi:hypothetical protein